MHPSKKLEFLKSKFLKSTVFPKSKKGNQEREAHPDSLQLCNEISAQTKTGSQSVLEKISLRRWIPFNNMYK